MQIAKNKNKAEKNRKQKTNEDDRNLIPVLKEPLQSRWLKLFI
jgi:hypothetical protein